MDSISASTDQWLDSAPDGLVIVDSAGVIQLVNRNAAAMLGYEREELVDQPIEIVVPERATPEHKGYRDNFFRSLTARAMGAGLDIVARRKDGRELPVDVALSILQTSHGTLVSAAIRDISQLKEFERRFEAVEAAERLAAIVESSHDAIIGKTLTGVITSWNAAAERMYGYTAQEIMGDNISRLMPGDRAGELAPVLEQVARGEAVQLLETQRVTQDGSILDVSVAISPVRDMSGEVIGASTVARDITERLRSERYRQMLEAQLHRSQRLESLGQLAGGVAHDFNNVLAAIMNYATLVSAGLHDEVRRRGSPDDEALVTLLDDVEQITTAAERAATLTRQLLTFSRREVLRPQLLDLNAVVGDMERLLRTTIGQNVDHLQLVFAQDLPPITIDRGQIEQVVMNLAVNARDAMAAGGELSIETSIVEIDEEAGQLRELEQGTYVVLSVSDPGTGMNREVAARAFEPFFTTKPAGEGTGLGLATVFGIVTQAGGSVAIYSEPGLGTTVRVCLPATAYAKPEARSEQPSASLRARGETVLLVEDEEIVREPTRRMLARSGYTVLEASNTDDALELMRAHSGVIDVLLTDVVMPGRSGKDLSVEVLKQRSETKVLFMSGYSENVIVHRGVIDEGVNLIEKPFSADELLRRIREMLDGDPQD
jgi:PAS domain S-box-containing protein